MGTGAVRGICEYRFIGEAPQENEIVDYELTWLPEGYSETESHILAGSSITIYKNESGRIIQFSYSQGGDATSLFVKSNYSKIITIELGSTVAEYYEAEEQSDANALTMDVRRWRNNVLYYSF